VRRLKRGVAMSGEIRHIIIEKFRKPSCVAMGSIRIPTVVSKNFPAFSLIVCHRNLDRVSTAQTFSRFDTRR
jgi:hypothetical protein